MTEELLNKLQTADILEYEKLISDHAVSKYAAAHDPLYTEAVYTIEHCSIHEPNNALIHAALNPELGIIDKLLDAGACVTRVAAHYAEGELRDKLNNMSHKLSDVDHELQVLLKETHPSLSKKEIIKIVTSVIVNDPLTSIAHWWRDIQNYAGYVMRFGLAESSKFHIEIIKAFIFCDDSSSLDHAIEYPIHKIDMKEIAVFCVEYGSDACWDVMLDKLDDDPVLTNYLQDYIKSKRNVRSHITSSLV